ncbi:adenosylcobinamide-GDP ribazoletransferase [Pseudooceanicola sp.]|uniref:adenosylcobinamide-GDP ribazoletransferase n=1 Tax=Pseudooceanicola sp. TaxID=1914328 RepID=UPI00260A2912|nr:adenosylcobinamide-GDP ribazoletransferase [Pseudooceanicola sp.]MDF1856135.1 adenosylcobinamide-GDP ribazoletransferase [Pseudooceanicola sp.]
MTDHRPHLTDIRSALALLSRLPLNREATPAAGAVWAFPLAGALLGALMALSASLALGLGLPPTLAALVALVVAVLLTGALHEDGLSDVADGFGGGWTREKRLEIMRDSRIGSYGAVALGLSLIARWQALTLILDSGHHWAALIATAALSRATMPALMAALPHARDDGLSRAVGRPKAGMAGLAAGLAALIALAGLGAAGGLGACAVTVLITLAVGALARSRIGGQTGDVLGAAQQLAEIAVLFAISVHISV